MKQARVPYETVANALGADRIALALEQRGVVVTRTGSRGLSALEPLIEIDGVLYGPITDLEDLDSARIGSVAGLPGFGVQRRLIFDRCGTVDPLDYDPTWLRRQLARDPDEIIAEIEVSGLRGRGGAGFPAHIKWRTVRDTPASQRYVVVNADEGDSGTFADRLIMEGDPFKLIEGMLLAGHAAGADHGVVYLRSEYPLAENIFSRALDRAQVMGLLDRFRVDLFVGAGAYICGEETSLLESLEGRRGEVRAKPPVPAVAGLFGCPTLVHNVITLCSVPAIVKQGGAAYAEHGVGASTGTMPFQLAGNVARGGLYELPFGMPLIELIESLGGGTRSGRPIGAVQVGGPLGAYLRPDQLEVPLTYEALAGIGAGIGHGGIVVFDDTVDLARQAHYAFAFCAHESCGKCTPCRIGAVRGVEAMEALLERPGDEAVLTQIVELCDVMEQASLCQMGGMTPIPVRTALGLS
jgi:formate dehydrogenase iron-sulfur subunit